MAVPAGTVTLLLADVEGSTRLWETEPERMTDAIARLDAVLADVEAATGAVRPLEQGEGDSFVLAFTRAADAVQSALDLQRADLGPLRLRIGVHTGDVQLRDERNYVGPTINRTARLRNIGHGGQTLLSQAVHDLVVDRLPMGSSLIDLGTHRLRDLARPERVYQLAAADLVVDFPPLRSLDLHPNNLPVQLTSVVGRERELADLSALLLDSRLLTLTGAGGSGKTRLALQLAADALAEHPDGVWWVDLAPVSDPDYVPIAVQHALDVQDPSAGSALASVVRRVGAARMLLVLDNCEHQIVPCAETVATLLRGCPGLTIVATSREPLDVAGERTWRTPSLSLDGGSGGDPAWSEAVELFVERAQQARHDFAITPANGAAIERICERLDGIPLAIELAAGRVRVLSPEQIADGLDDRFALLTGGSRSAVPRQQTLRASVEWSHDLLTEPEKVLFRRLAVFAGPFDLSAAEVVGAGDGLERHQVLDQLTMLIDKSLVVADGGGASTRYRLLETVRHYAMERLAEAGEERVTRDRHRDHYVALVDTARQNVVGPAQDEWLDVLQLELDNLRVAFHHSVEGAADVAMLLAVALEPLWWIRGYWAEGRRWLETALASDAPMSPVVRALGLAASAAIAGHSYDEVAAERVDQALALVDDTTDCVVLSTVLREAGTAVHLTDPMRSIELLRDASDRARSLGDPALLAMSLQTLSVPLILVGDLTAAAEAASECAALAERVGSAYLRQWARLAAGRVRAWSDPTRARLALRGIGDEAERAGDRTSIVMARAFEAQIAADMGDVAVARDLVVPAVAISGEMGSRFHHAIAQGTDALVALAAGEADRACDAFLAARATVAGAASLEAYFLGPWAEAELHAGRTDDARRRADDGITLSDEWSFALWGCLSMRARARIALTDGDGELAEALAHRAVVIAAKADERIASADLIEILGAVAVEQGRLEEGARLIGAARGIRSGLRVVPWRWNAAWSDQLVASIKESDAKIADAFVAGEALSLEEAVAYARRGRGSRRRPTSGWSSLTPAEHDVTRLVSEGLSNKQIALKLFVSPRTVQTHLQHIYGKLGINSRVELTRHFLDRSKED